MMNEDIMMEDQMSEGYEPDQGFEGDAPYDGGGWPGDGSGTDDFEDMNQNEADDDRNEGMDETPLGEDMGGE